MHFENFKIVWARLGCDYLSRDRYVFLDISSYARENKHSIKLAKMYRRLLKQRITYYNGQWYCYLCKIVLQNLTEAQYHSENAHSVISTEVSDFLKKSIKMSNKRCKQLLQHSIVIRDVEQDYFCICCQCSVPSHNFNHLKEKDHQECMNVILKQSTNEQLDSNDMNNKQSDVSVNVENPMEHTNESNLSVEIQPISEIKLVEESSNNFTQMTNKTIANIPYALIQEAKMNKHFMMQHTIHYGQWYCHVCKSMFQSLGDVECHLQEAHPGIGIQRLDFLDKSIELSDTNYRELSNINHEIAMQDIPQDYFCIPCQCSLPSLHHFYEHSMGKKHKHMIKCNEKRINANIGLQYWTPEDPPNRQKLNDNITANENISVNVFDENDSIRNRPSNSRAEEKIIVHKSNMSSTRFVDQSPAITDNISDDVLQNIDAAFCCLCDMFIYKTIIKDHMTDRRHRLAVSALKIKQQTSFIIKLEKEKEIINALQLNSKKLDGTMWPEYTETAAKYTCDKCNKVVEENDIINHETIVHQSSMMSSLKSIYNWLYMIIFFNVAIDYPLFKCSFCNEIIHGILSLLIHFSKREHVENIKSLIEVKRREYDNCENIQIYFEPVEFLSLISFENNAGTVQIKEQPVIYIKNHSTTFWTNSIRKTFTYVCFTCQCKFNDICDIINHLCGTLKHFMQLKKIFFTYGHLYNVSKSKELNVNETHEVKSLVCTEDISIDNESLKTRNIDETRLNTEQYHDNLTTAVNTSSENDILCQNKENNSGIFISPDIFININNLIFKSTDFVQNQSCIQVNKKSALNRYNKKYCTEFFDFEEIMFTCSQRKLKEIKSNLRFFYPFWDKMMCLVCNEQQLCNVQTIYEHITCKKHITEFTKLHENYLELLKELVQIPSIYDIKQYAKCYACTMNIYGMSPHFAENIYYYKLHTSSRLHKYKRKQLLSQIERLLKEFQNLWYNIQWFACVECDKRFKTKIKFMEHLNVAHKAVLSQKDNSMFDFCLTCATLWYQNTHHTEIIHTNYQAHCQQQTHQYLEKTNDFAVTELLQPLQKLLRNVDGTAANLFKLSNNVLNDPKVTQLTDALKHIFEIHQLPVEICMFGSRVTGLALPNSDIDIYLNFGNECIKNVPELIKSRSKQIQDCLRTDHDTWNIELILDKSRTPIIKVKHRLTGLQCDISFMNALALENSKLIRSFNTAYPPCQKLMLFLKKWISLAGLTGHKGITNYALVWLVIFYLQVKFKIPSIAALIKKHNQSKIISGWETGVGDTVLINIPERPTHELLLGFFKYYGSFDYMHFVICPLLGKTCRKRAFTNISTLPNSMALYITQLQNENPEYFRIDSPMCVQDPFDLSHNLTKAMPILMLKRFKHYCNESYNKLC